MNPSVSVINVRLDEYIRLLMQADGISYVADQYVSLREEYYRQRELDTKS